MTANKSFQRTASGRPPLVVTGQVLRSALAAAELNR